MLIGQFFGTSAAEGIPAPFCQCEVCRQAREKKGVYRRRRSCFRLSDKIMLDLGADAVSQCEEYGDITAVDHVLITHTHDDHLNPHMMMEAFWSRKDRGGPLHYYFTDQAFDMVRHWRENEWILKGKVPEWERDGVVAFHQLHYGQRTQVEDVFVTPFRGNHKGNVGENTALYLIELPDGRSLFYGLDSGCYLPETIEALKDHRIDLFISECTAGASAISYPGTHMGIRDVCDLTNKLYRQGTLHDDSTLWLTHINHRTGHDQMLEAAASLPFPVKTVVAFDGLRIL
ncbi:MAG: MBL fold metallo-hydrolase [Clostridia bacterium]|nr:MBL fold metallo-hydrolase [Clostridia bacterium]